MKLAMTGIGFLVLGICVFVYLAITYPRRGPSEPVPRVRAVSQGDDREVAQLVRQAQELQGRLNSLRSQMTQLDASAAHVAPTRDYTAGVEQSFANEKVDAEWATGTASKVANTLDGDEMLKGVARTVECRSQTCRVQIEDDGSNRLARRMPFIATGLANVLPSISAQHIDQGNGRSAMVLYLSSQPSTNN